MIKFAELDAAAARMLVQRCFEDLIRQAEHRGAYITRSQQPELESAEQSELSRDRLRNLTDLVQHPRAVADIEMIVDGYLAEQCVRLQDLPEARRMDLVTGFARALAEEQRHFLFRLQDRLTPFVPADPLFSASPAVQLTAQPGLPAEWQLTSHSTPMGSSAAGPTIGIAVEQYLAAGAKRWVGKTLAARRWQLRYLTEFFGAATTLNMISSHHVRAYRDAVMRLRANHGRSPVHSFAEKQTDNEAKRLAPKSAELIFQPCKAFFRWAKSEEGMIAANPAEDVRIVVSAKTKAVKSRRPFTAPELERLFGSSTFTGSKSRNRRYEPGNMIIRDYKFWVPILGYYTGARLGELIQLHVGDVHLEGPVPYLSINEEPVEGSSAVQKHVKSAAGVRMVPLHPDIMAIGFANFFAKRCSGKKAIRLFPECPYGSDGQASTVASKWFARLMDKVGLNDPGLVFHSFRHNAEDAFRDAGLQQYVIDRVIGHSDGSVSAGYGNGVSLDTMHEAVKAMKSKLSLVGIVVPS